MLGNCRQLLSFDSNVNMLHCLANIASIIIRLMFYCVSISFDLLQLEIEHFALLHFINNVIVFLTVHLHCDFKLIRYTRGRHIRTIRPILIVVWTVCLMDRKYSLKCVMNKYENSAVSVLTFMVIFRRRSDLISDPRKITMKGKTLIKYRIQIPEFYARLCLFLRFVVLKTLSSLIIFMCLYIDLLEFICQFAARFAIDVLKRSVVN